MQTNDPSDVCGDAFAVRASVDIEAANYSTPFADDAVDSLVVSGFDPSCDHLTAELFKKPHIG